MKFPIKQCILFLIINFAALGLGSYLMGEGPSGDWYKNLNRAPWEPPGWVFGAAWTFIMICFSIFMAFLVEKIGTTKVWVLYILQLILNVIWNPIFFAQHKTELALGVIISLALVVGYFMTSTKKHLGKKSLLVLPYYVWLIIATSLNIYVVMYN